VLNLLPGAYRRALHSLIVKAIQKPEGTKLALDYSHKIDWSLLKDLLESLGFTVDKATPPRFAQYPAGLKPKLEQIIKRIKVHEYLVLAFENLASLI